MAARLNLRDRERDAASRPLGAHERSSRNEKIEIHGGHANSGGPCDGLRVVGEAMSRKVGAR